MTFLAGPFATIAEYGPTAIRAWPVKVAMVWKTKGFIKTGVYTVYLPGLFHFSFSDRSLAWQSRSTMAIRPSASVFPILRRFPERAKISKMNFMIRKQSRTGYYLVGQVSLRANRVTADGQTSDNFDIFRFQSIHSMHKTCYC